MYKKIVIITNIIVFQLSPNTKKFGSQKDKLLYSTYTKTREVHMYFAK